MQTTKEQKVKSMAEHFSSLVAQAEKIAFPNYRSGILAQQDTTGWNKLRKFIYQVGHPFHIDAKMSLGGVFLIFVAFTLGFYGWPIGLDLLYVTLSGKFGLFQISDIYKGFFLPYGVISAIILIPVSYHWWLEIITEQRYSRRVKFLLFVIYLAIFADFNRQAIAKIPPLLFSWHAVEGKLLVGLYLLLIIPATTFMLAILVDSFLLVLYIGRTIFGGVDSMHNPLPIKQVESLVFIDIPSITNDGETWNLLKLTKSEVRSLLEWAQANRDATEKRTIPFSIVLGIIGVLAISDLVRLQADSFIANFLTNISRGPSSFPEGILFLFLLIVFAKLIQYLVRLFVNLAVQNIVVEACILAEHAVENIDPPQSNKKSLLETLLSLWNK